MDNLNIIDRFTQVFSTYIDSGFGLLTGDVAFLTSILVGIDITLAGLFWAMDGGEAIPRLLRKVLYVGAFALLLNNWASLSNVVFQSFAGLGLQATENRLSPEDLLRPGYVAGTGFEAAHPLLEQAGSMIGFTTFFDNIVTVLVLLFAWAVVILAFFVLAVQLFITIIEFKLTTLAGFVLVPFALWNRTAFLAERVLGNVVGAGIKMMVLGVIVAIGSTLFGDFAGALKGKEPDLAQAMSLVLGAIALFGLGIFGPGIAAGLTSGAPQLGAGAAVGAVGGVAAGSLAAGGLALGASRLATAGAVSAIRAGTSLTSGTAAAFGLGRATSGATGAAGVAAGLAGVGRAGAGAVAEQVRGLGARLAGGARGAADTGRRAAWRTTGGAASGEPSPAAGGEGVPNWAAQLRAEQRRRHQLHLVGQAVREGDRPGSGANPELREKD